MRNWGLFCSFVLLSALSFLPEARAADLIAESSKERIFEFTYKVRVHSLKKGAGPVDVFIPLAKPDPHQDILSRIVQANVSGDIGKEKKYRNEFWHAHLDSSDGSDIEVTVSYRVLRKLYQVQVLENLTQEIFSEQDLKGEELFLGANQLVPISGSMIEKVQQDLPKTIKNTPLLRARAIYDYVVDTMEYKKVGKGWGNGDTHWACSKRYGNCTDFHALFISLARAEGIPAKFEIGFPLPLDKQEARIKGYHCWVTFKLPKVGWTPVDASEAKKHPEKRELLFGTQPVDRIKFTEGRDLELGKGHKTKPLNYFIYPHVEVKGKRHDKLDTKFSVKQTKN
jgi:transglutaminase-like putative cysteine protease